MLGSPTHDDGEHAEERIIAPQRREGARKVEAGVDDEDQHESEAAADSISGQSHRDASDGVVGDGGDGVVAAAAAVVVAVVGPCRPRATSVGYT